MPSFETSFDRYEARRLLRYMQTLAEGKAEAAEEPEAPAVPEPPSAPEIALAASLRNGRTGCDAAPNKAWSA